MKWIAPTPLEYFASLVRGGSLPLFEAAASLAQDDDPRLDVLQLQTDMDRLLLRLKRRLPADAGALTRLRMLHHFFYSELGFAANRNDYYAARNSYLHEVLRTRLGIPVSLAVLWLEFARGIGLRADGVSFPGHFLVKVRLPDGHVVMDPVSGQSLSSGDLSERLEPLRERLGVEDAGELPLALYLQPASAHEIIARMLRNLKEIHHASQDWAQLVAVQDRLLVLDPQAWGEWRDRGLARAELGLMVQAAEDLETYLAHASDAQDAPLIARRVRALRHRRSAGGSD